MGLYLKVARRFAEVFCFIIISGLPGMAAASPFDCKTNHCGIAIDAPYPNLVIGVVDGVATPAQSAALLGAAQRAGYWHVFPSSGPVFAEKIQPISISFASGRSITVLAATGETRMLRLNLGELVRFAPHRGLHEAPQPNNPYWVGIGCVALLCAAGDTQCEAGYHPGLYRRSDGGALDATGTHLLPGEIGVDPMSMRPKAH